MADFGGSNLVTVSCADHGVCVANALRNLFDTKRGTDIDFRYDERSVRAHKIILEMFLAPEIIGQIKNEQHVPEVKQEVPDADDGSANVLDFVLEFLYKGEVTVPVWQLEDLLRVAKELDFGMLVESVQYCNQSDCWKPQCDDQQEEEDIKMEGGGDCSENPDLDESWNGVWNEKAGNYSEYSHRSMVETEVDIRECPENEVAGESLNGIAISDGRSCFKTSAKAKRLSKSAVSKNPNSIDASPSWMQAGGLVEMQFQYGNAESQTIFSDYGGLGQNLEPDREQECSKPGRFRLRSKKVRERNEVSGSAVFTHTQHGGGEVGSGAAVGDSVHYSDNLDMGAMDGTSVVFIGEGGVEMFRCFHCDFETPSYSKRLGHLMAVHGLNAAGEVVAKHRCDECDYENFNYAKFARHKRLKHQKKAETYACPHCDCVVTRKIHLEKHVIATHGIGVCEFTCDTCGKRCSSSGNLKQHKLSHTQERPFRCPHCSFATNWNLRLKSHILSKHKSDANVPIKGGPAKRPRKKP